MTPPMLAGIKILFMVENFRQGWGGGPESVRLMARRLGCLGVTCDVVDRGKLHRAIEAMELLPIDTSRAERFVPARAGDYHASLQVGPWQNPWRTWEILRARRFSAPHYYLPRGGLAEVEFSGMRGLKKYPYYSMIESRFLRTCDAVIYSSEIERRSTFFLYPDETRTAVIPDYFESGVSIPRNRRGPDVLRLGFLAEIAPRKGLLEFMRGFAHWCRGEVERGIGVHLTVGGGVRPGSERYIAQVRDISDAIPGVEIEYRGPVSHADRPAFYAETDVFLLPSTFESFGLTALEATSAGCVLLCSPFVGALEYFSRSPNVIILDDLGVPSIVRGLDRAVLAAEQPRSAASVAGTAARVVSDVNAIANERWARFLLPSRDSMSPQSRPSSSLSPDRIASTDSRPRKVQI